MGWGDGRQVRAWRRVSGMGRWIQVARLAGGQQSQRPTSASTIPSDGMSHVTLLAGLESAARHASLHRISCAFTRLRLIPSLLDVT